MSSQIVRFQCSVTLQASMNFLLSNHDLAALLKNEWGVPYVRMSQALLKMKSATSESPEAERHRCTVPRRKIPPRPLHSTAFSEAQREEEELLTPSDPRQPHRPSKRPKYRQNGKRLLGPGSVCDGACLLRRESWWNGGGRWVKASEHGKELRWSTPADFSKRRSL